MSFCIIEKDKAMPKIFATNYRSAIILGRARILTDDTDRRYALESVIEKYSADYQAEGKREIEQTLKATAVVEIIIEHIAGKTAIKSVQDAE